VLLMLHNDRFAVDVDVDVAVVDGDNNDGMDDFYLD
jgi:hypothetical protein